MDNQLKIEQYVKYLETLNLNYNYVFKRLHADNYIIYIYNNIIDMTVGINYKNCETFDDFMNGLQIFFLQAKYGYNISDDKFFYKQVYGKIEEIRIEIENKKLEDAIKKPKKQLARIKI